MVAVVAITLSDPARHSTPPRRSVGLIHDATDHVDAAVASLVADMAGRLTAGLGPRRRR